VVEVELVEDVVVEGTVVVVDGRVVVGARGAVGRAATEGAGAA
jgi:hypothetical protein